MDLLIKWIMEAPAVRLVIFTAISSLIGIIIGTFLTIIFWPFIKQAFSKIGEILLKKLNLANYESRYLKWIISDLKNLPVLPTTLVSFLDKPCPNLDSVYVSLNLHKNNNKKPLDLSDVILANSSILILGDPGAGKTTLMRFLAYNIAKARYNNRNILLRLLHLFDHSYIVGRKLHAIPIYIPLSRMSEIVSKYENTSLITAITSQLKLIDNLKDLPDNFFLKYIKKNQIIFLFDAYDELGDVELKDKMGNLIKDLVNTISKDDIHKSISFKLKNVILELFSFMDLFITNYKDNRVVVTSRIIGYSGQLNQHFNSYVIQPLSWENTCRLVTNWYKILNNEASVDDLLDRLKANTRLAALASNPMHLSLIALVQFILKLIPDKRHVLYDECIRILINRKYAPMSVQDSFNKTLPAEEAILILRELALIMHNNYVREVKRRDIEKKYLPEIIDRINLSCLLSISTSDIIKNLEERSQIIVEIGIDQDGDHVMAFSHLTFQEYLVAVVIKENDNVFYGLNKNNELLERYKHNVNWWEEVILLYSAMLHPDDKSKFIALINS